MNAYVFIGLMPGVDPAASIIAISAVAGEIRWVDLVYGPTDAIARVETEDADRFNAVVSLIHSHNTVSSTDTRIIADSA